MANGATPSPRPPFFRRQAPQPEGSGDRVSQLVFGTVMSAGLSLGWIPVLVLGLKRRAAAADGSAATPTAGYNVTAAAGGGGGGGKSVDVSAEAMVIGGSIWSFIVGLACLGFGA